MSLLLRLIFLTYRKMSQGVIGMKNINYDLVKLLQSKLDNSWRLKNFYCKDATNEQSESLDVLNQILEDENRHIKLLKKEIEKRIKNNLFD
jgi:hypothetical protein